MACGERTGAVRGPCVTRRVCHIPQGHRTGTVGPPYGCRRVPLEFLRPPQCFGCPQKSIENARSPYARRTVAVEPFYGMATACPIATANVEIKKIKMQRL